MLASFFYLFQFCSIPLSMEERRETEYSVIQCFNEVFHFVLHAFLINS